MIASIHILTSLVSSRGIPYLEPQILWVEPCKLFRLDSHEGRLSLHQVGPTQDCFEQLGIGEV